jgi:hypothetical protein
MGVSMETHQLVVNGHVEEFQAQKLMQPIWGNDYLIYYYSGHACYYDSQMNCVSDLLGDHINERVQVRVKPQDKPWTATDAVKYLGMYLHRENHATVGKIECVSMLGVNLSYGGFKLYKTLQMEKMYVSLDYVGNVTAYHKAE